MRLSYTCTQIGVAFAEDQRAVGGLGPCGEQESFPVDVRAETAGGKDHDGFDQSSEKCLGLPGWFRRRSRPLTCRLPVRAWAAWRLCAHYGCEDRPNDETHPGRPGQNDRLAGFCCGMGNTHRGPVPAIAFIGLRPLGV